MSEPKIIYLGPACEADTGDRRMSEAHCNNLPQRKTLGLVTHDNTGGPFVVECQGCGEVYPSFHCLGGGQIADTGDYEDARCPHCEQVDPEECDYASLAWNTQQLKINELQKRLNAADQRIDELTQPKAETVWCACGDGHAANSYGAGILAANNGVCENCDAAGGGCQEPVLIQAVAVTREGDDGMYLEWLLEGGICELELPGTMLFALPEANDLCDEDGSAEIYTSPPAPVSVDAAKTFAKGFNTLETVDGKYKIVMQFAGHNDAWAAYTALGKLTRTEGDNP